MRPTIALPIFALALAACGGSATPITPVAPEKVGEIGGLKVPESARYDALRDVWYISNINGVPSEKDGNGFITRVSGDLATVDTLFIAGGVNGAVLHAPKGMILVGDTLWVADIDAVRAFDVVTGAVVATVDVPGAVFLNDPVRGSDGAIYITDTGIRITAEGTTHPGPDRIFKLVGREISTAMTFDTPIGPNGLAMDDANGRIIMVPFGSPTIYAFAPGATTADSIASGPGGYDGVAVLGDGRLLISSWTDSTVHALDGTTLAPFVKGLPSPADLGVDTVRGQFAVPLFDAGRVEFWTIPAR
jgi:outer membrane protein assembly factor BamB